MKLRVLALLAALFGAAGAEAQVLAEWVENDPANDPNKIALGYTVPIPVDTPLPFDGFRTYQGLHARHQDLAATTPWVHPESIGKTLYDRTIWAYRLGDADRETIYGLPEGASLTNGGIHAREWQTPEIVTGILELIATRPRDHHFYDYLRDNLNMVVIPVLNIDGFLQTQRYPKDNYLQSDPDFPDTSPRDGRMRRKNLRLADENLASVGDHLHGVDLNRNNDPYWATNDRSSPDNRSLVHHGSTPQSEPETRALDIAAQLGPEEQLRIYTDVHSFSQVHFWNTNNNNRLGSQTSIVLGLFTRHHRAFPAQKNYVAVSPTNNAGIGTTAEYFTNRYLVPSWTLEVEPSQGAPYHPSLPGYGADYGGVLENGHDGFILPESQIRRVREQLAETFAAVYYRQAGPPSIQALRVLDRATAAVVFDAEWDVSGPLSRELYHRQYRPLQLGRDYTLQIAFNKPMRWREGGEVVPFRGQNDGFLSTFSQFSVGDENLSMEIAGTTWLNRPGDYLDYQDDTLATDFSLPLDSTNAFLVDGETVVTVRNLAWDMTSGLIDADPSTVAYWGGGHWNNHENTAGEDSDSGGEDATISLQVTDQEVAAPFLLQPGTAAAWGDPQRVGEGFILEMLANGAAVMFWFTNDDEGGQDWYIGVGSVRGNRIIFPEVLRVSGGVFGDAFDPDLVTEEVVGHASFTWEDCANGTMKWHIGNRAGRQTLVRLTTLMGLVCGPPSAAPVTANANYSGSWGDPTHDGEGFTVEVLEDGSALVFWFSFGPDGKRRWYFGIGQLADGKYVFDNMLTTVGGVFGAGFDPDDVEEVHWGTLQLELTCGGGTATYASVEQGFGSGQQNLATITRMDGLDCTP